MKLICIAEGTYKITKGKTYTVNIHSTHFYWIRDDEGHIQLMSKNKIFRRDDVSHNKKKRNERDTKKSEIFNQTKHT